MSVTPPRLPNVVPNATASPPAVRSLLFASLSWTVIVDVLLPSAVMLVGDAEIVDVVADAAPGVRVTVASSVIDAALTVPVTSAVPVVVGDVSVAVYVPSPLSVTDPGCPPSWQARPRHRQQSGCCCSRP